MRLTPTLTKENFFNEMSTKYPLAMRKFCQWIDDYKKAVNWDSLFANHMQGYHNGRPSPNIKFHHLPYAMQNGIWLEFCAQTLHTFFEQPEHSSCTVDLEEDIKGVFESIEPLLKEDET
jgi:hypothetical protein